MSKNYTELMNACREAATAYKLTFNDETKTDYEKAVAFNLLTARIDAYNDAVREDAYKALILGTDTVKTCITNFAFSGVKKAKMTWQKTVEGEPKKLCMVLIEDAKDEIFDLSTLAQMVDEYNEKVEDKLHPFHVDCWREKVADLTRLFNSIEMRATGACAGKFKTKGSTRKDIVTTYMVGDEIVTSDPTEKYSYDVSMNSLKKAVQDVIDSILFEDNGKGKNVYMVKTEDVMYIFTRVTKYNPKTHRSSTVRQYMFSLLFDVLGKRVAGYDYVMASVK